MRRSQPPLYGARASSPSVTYTTAYPCWRRTCSLPRCWHYHALLRRPTEAQQRLKWQLGGTTLPSRRLLRSRRSHRWNATVLWGRVRTTWVPMLSHILTNRPEDAPLGLDRLGDSAAHQYHPAAVQTIKMLQDKIPTDDPTGAGPAHPVKPPRQHSRFIQWLKTHRCLGGLSSA